MICECACEQNAELGSSECNGQGNYTCGVCMCNPERYGEKCECDAQTQADDSLCKQPNSTNPDVVCSNQGSCICKKCVCDKRTVLNLI